jgi:DNA invertase Pin-like site-specific DNA recombinase
VVLIKPLGEDFTLGKLRQRSNLFKSHWSNQWLTNFQLIDAGRRREIDAVLVWRLDRWGRSLADLVTTLKELAELGVGFVSLTEALDMTTATGRAMVGLLAVFAQFEHDLLRERVRAGLAEARLKGKRLGRPATVSVHAVAVRKPLRAGVSKAEIARRMNLARTSVRRLLADHSRAK